MSEKITSKKIGNAVIWSFAAEIAAKLLVPITNMILARILVPEAFGIIATINMIVSFADMLSTTGISKYVVQHEFKTEEELYENANVAFWTNMCISVLAWLVISIFSKPLSAMVGNPGYELSLIVASLSLPLTAFSSVQEAIFQRSLHYKTLFYLRLAVSLLPFFVTIPLALMGAGHWALIAGTLASNLLRIVMMYSASPWKPKFYYSFDKLKTMFSFCIWMLLGAITSWAITYIDVLLVSNRMGEYYTGLYKNSQTTVTGIISIITAATTSVLFASLSRAQTDDRKFSDLLFSFQKKVGMFIIPMGVGIYCFSDLITLILLGKQWLEASKFIGIFGFSTAMICVFADFCKEACKSKGKPQVQFYVQLMYLIILIPICYYGVSRGFDTLGLVRSLSNFVLIIIYLIFMKFTINISPLKMVWNEKIPILAATIMGFAAKMMLNNLSDGFIFQFIYISICIIIYFIVLCISKEYRKEVVDIINLLRLKIKH